MVILNYCQKIGCPAGQPAGRQLHCLVRPSWGPGVCCFLTSALILRTLSSVSSGGPTSGPKVWVRLWFRLQKAPGESVSAASGASQKSMACLGQALLHCSSLPLLSHDLYCCVSVFTWPTSSKDHTLCGSSFCQDAVQNRLQSLGD